MKGLQEITDRKLSTLMCQVVWHNFVGRNLALTGTKHIQAVLAKKFLLTCDLSERKTND